MRLMAKIFGNLLQIIAVCLLLLEFSHGKPKLNLNTMGLRTAAHAFTPSKVKFNNVGGFAGLFGSAANSNKSVAKREISQQILPNDTETIDWQRSKRSLEDYIINLLNATGENISPQEDWQRSKRSLDTMIQNGFNATDENVTPQRTKRSVHSVNSSLAAIFQELDTLLPHPHYHDRTKRSPCKGGGSGGGSGANIDDGALDYEDNIDLAERRKKAARRRKAAQQKKAKNSRKNSKLVDDDEVQQTLRRRKRETDVDKTTKDISGKAQQIGETVRGVWESFAQTMSSIAESVQQAVKSNGGN